MCTFIFVLVFVDWVPEKWFPDCGICDNKITNPLIFIQSRIFIHIKLGWFKEMNACFSGKGTNFQAKRAKTNKGGRGVKYELRVGTCKFRYTGYEIWFASYKF